MIHTVCKRVEAVKLRAKIKELDPKAFVTVLSVNEVKYQPKNH